MAAEAGDQLCEFVQLVEEMRTAQRQYFSSRSSIDLTRSRLLETKVDKSIRRLTERSQQTLFSQLTE